MPGKVKVLVNEKTQKAQAAANAEAKRVQAKALFAQAGQLQAKLDIIAEYLGLK